MEAIAVTTAPPTDDDDASRSPSYDSFEQQHQNVPVGSQAAHNMPPTGFTSTMQQPGVASLPRWYPRRCRTGKPVYYGNSEALGWALDTMGRSVAFIGAGAFLSTALLRLAKAAAGCAVDPDPATNVVPECHARVFGLFRPSSLLATYTIIVGVISAALLPLMGAIVDYTPHRLRVGQVLSVTMCVLAVPQIFVNAHTWVAVAIVHIGLAFTGWAQTMVTYAFLPELTSSETILREYTKSFTILSFSSQIVYLASIVGLATAFGFASDDIAVAQFAMAVVFVASVVFLYPAWFCLFQPRPAARALPTGRSLWTAGFVQVWQTSVYIYKTLPALKWFYFSVALIDAAVNSLAVIFITYVTDTMLFTSSENGIAILCTLLGSIPGAFLASCTTQWRDPIQSNMIATAVFLLNTLIVSIVLTGPGQQYETYALGHVWGIGAGWKWTTDRLLAATVIPKGQDAELMGTYLFAGQILTWLPPLVFTVLNEAGISQRVGIGSLCIWFLAGLICLCCMGSYRDAVMAAGRSDVLEDSAAVEESGGGGDSDVVVNNKTELRPEADKGELEFPRVQDAQSNGPLR